MDEYTLGLSMIFGIPIFMIIIAYGAIVLGIATLVIAFVSMRKIIKQYKDNKKLPYIICIVEILVYIICILKNLLY